MLMDERRSFRMRKKTCKHVNIQGGKALFSVEMLGKGKGKGAGWRDIKTGIFQPSLFLRCTVSRYQNVVRMGAHVYLSML